MDEKSLQTKIEEAQDHANKAEEPVSATKDEIEGLVRASDRISVST